MRLGVGAGLLLVALAATADRDRVHVVKPGETLWQITEAITGEPDRWPELYRANRDQIKDPSVLYPGQQLAIPDFDAPLDVEPSTGEDSAGQSATGASD